MSEESPLTMKKGDDPAEQKCLLEESLSDQETSLGYILKLAWPMVVTNISFTVMQFIDVRMVAELGTNQLAAILPASFLSFIPASFAMGVIAIVNTFVSQSLGRESKKECSSYCWQAIYMGLTYALVVLSIFWPLAGSIFRGIGQPHEVIQMEVDYFHIMLYCQYPIILIWASSQFFMGIHRPIITMYAALVGQVINLAANYVLIFGKFGAPAMGIAGAGWGTFIGVTVGAGIRMGMFLSRDINRTYGSRHTLGIAFSKMWLILRFGVPAGFGFMVNMALWGLILFGLVGSFGKESLAATSAVWSCVRIAFLPVIGVGTALTAAVGKMIGRGRKDLAFKQVRVCLHLALIYMGLIGLAFFIFRKPLMQFWTSDAKVIEVGVKLLICAAVFQVFDGVLIIYGAALRGAGDTIWLAAIEALGAVFILGLGGFAMVRFFPEFGSLGPWMAAAGKIAFGAWANWWRFQGGKWKRIDMFKRRAVVVAGEIGTEVE